MLSTEALQTHLLILVLVATTLTGCAISYGASSRSESKIPPAPPGSDLQKWEHLCVAMAYTTPTETLNKAGDEGWELVGFTRSESGGSMTCFKRPADE